MKQRKQPISIKVKLFNVIALGKSYKISAHKPKRKTRRKSCNVIALGKSYKISADKPKRKTRRKSCSCENPLQPGLW